MTISPWYDMNEEQDTPPKIMCFRRMTFGAPTGEFHRGDPHREYRLVATTWGYVDIYVTTDGGFPAWEINMDEDRSLAAAVNRLIRNKPMYDTYDLETDDIDLDSYAPDILD